MNELHNNEHNISFEEILEAYDLGNLKHSKNTDKQLANHRLISEASIKKDAHINIHLSSKDLRAIQSRAHQKMRLLTVNRRCM